MRVRNKEEQTQARIPFVVRKSVIVEIVSYEECSLPIEASTGVGRTKLLEHKVQLDYKLIECQ